MTIGQESWLLASLPYGACLVDREGKVVDANPALARLLGWEKAGRGRSLSGYLQEVAEPAQALWWAVALGQALTKGETTFLNVPARLRTGPEPGQTVTVVGAVAPWQGPEGRRQGAVVLVQDSAQFENVEDARLRFLSMMAHELSSPVNKIASAAEQMGRHLGHDVEAAGRLLGVIRGEAERMARLLRSLFAPEPGPGEGRARAPERVALGPLLRQVAERYRPVETVGEVAVEVPPGLPPAHADPQVLRDGLGSLLDSLLAHAPPGCRIVLAGEEGARGLVVRVHVRSAGQGGRAGGEGPRQGLEDVGFHLPLAPREEGGVEHG